VAIQLGSLELWKSNRESKPGERGRLAVKAGIRVGKMQRQVRKRQILRAKLVRLGGGSGDKICQGKWRNHYI
jgi:hypothetical protein